MLRALPILAALLFAAGAYAGDGVIEINHARAVRGLITPGDGAGYPITLDRGGSYRLTGELQVPDTNGVEITGDGVTLELNGFRIRQSGESETTGIIVSGSGATIRNGFVDGFPLRGISSSSPVHLVDLTVQYSGDGGVDVAEGSLLEGLIVRFSSGAGVTADASIIRHSVFSNNGGDGILCGYCTVVGNTLRLNGGNGISAGASSVTGNAAGENFRGILATASLVSGNASRLNTDRDLLIVNGSGYVQNNAGTILLNGGTSLESNGNICSGTLACP